MAASIALPVIFEPVLIDGRVLIDGGLVNPLPFDLLCDEADITVAIDVTGAPVRREDRDRPARREHRLALLRIEVVEEEGGVESGHPERLAASAYALVSDARCRQPRNIRGPSPHVRLNRPHGGA